MKDHAYFFDRLAERNADPDNSGAIDAALWNELGRSQAVMVTDMSGFTRVTRARGIIHFLALHVKSLALARPLVEEHGGRMVKREADNTISVFGRVNEAVAAAAAIHRTLAEHNARIDDALSHVHFSIGISSGQIMLLADDLYGDAVNVAYKLGEDIAAAGTTLVHETAFTEVGRPSADRRTVTIGGVELGFFEM